MARKNPSWFNLPNMTPSEKAMFDAVRVEMKSCRGCRFLDQSRVYTSDSWEYVEKWKCKVKNEVVYEYVEMFDKTELPEWCPLIEENIRAKKNKIEEEQMNDARNFFEI